VVHNLKISHIVNITDGIPNLFENCPVGRVNIETNRIKYLKIEIEDRPDEDMFKNYKLFKEFIEFRGQGVDYFEEQKVDKPSQVTI